MRITETGAKAGLPSGPWDTEPDQMEWSDGDTGLRCLIKRTPQLGNLCGYVGVPPGHPLHGQDYPDVRVSVHGLTFAGFHPDVDADTWWFGFDCAHHTDLVPGIARSGLPRDGVYRSIAVVQTEVTRLTHQLEYGQPSEQEEDS